MARRIVKTAPDKRAKLQHPDAVAAWFDARLDLIGRNRVGLSQEFDPSNKNWLQKILSGERRCQIAEAIWLADRFTMSLDDVLTRGLGYKIPTAPKLQAPLIGVVGGDSMITKRSVTEYIDAPPGSTAETVALRMETFQTALTMYSGTVLFYTPPKPPGMAVMPGSFGRLSVVLMGDQTAGIVGVMDRAPVRGLGRVTLLDGRTSIDSAQIAGAYPIEWMQSV